MFSILCLSSCIEFVSFFIKAKNVIYIERQTVHEIIIIHFAVSANICSWNAGKKKKGFRTTVIDTVTIRNVFAAYGSFHWLGIIVTNAIGFSASKKSL